MLCALAFLFDGVNRVCQLSGDRSWGARMNWEISYGVSNP